VKIGVSLTFRKKYVASISRVEENTTVPLEYQDICVTSRKITFFALQNFIFNNKAVISGIT
jgi:hypothetical protein